MPEEVDEKKRILEKNLNKRITIWLGARKIEGTIIKISGDYLEIKTDKNTLKLIAISKIKEFEVPEIQE
jgi:preprotein translocase subunit YajC